MTGIRFLRLAAAAPLVVPALAGLAVVCLAPLESLPGFFTIRGYAGTIAIAGLWSAVPYLLFLLVLYRFIRPSTIEAWHEVLGAAPFVIAVVFGVALGNRWTRVSVFYRGRWRVLLGRARSHHRVRLCGGNLGDRTDLPARRMDPRLMQPVGVPLPFVSCISILSMRLASNGTTPMTAGADATVVV